MPQPAARLRLPGPRRQFARRVAFGDHHRFTAEQAAELLMEADEQGLSLITTEKDRARMMGDPLIETLAQRTHVLPVTMVIEETEEMRRVMLEKLKQKPA